MKGTIKSDIAKEYLMKFPNTPNLTLAKKIYAENKSVYTNLEQVRSQIRLLKGAHGTWHKQNSHVEFRKEFEALKKELPKGESERIHPYKLPKTSKKILIISDLHIPYHNDDAVFAALEYGLDQEVDTIIINGDLIDFATISRHEKDMRKRSVKYEIDCTKVFLKGLRAMFPKALIVWSYGNHDLRYDKYIMQKAPEIFDIELIQLHELLKLRDLNIIKVDSTQYIYAGKLAIFHGHETGLTSGGVNPARSLRLKLNKSAVTSHFHRETKDMGKNLDEHPYSCYSIGCLCDLFPTYLPVNMWTHGFGYLELNDKGDYNFNLKSIIEGKVF
jgi:predicted phosphodiesterase